MSISESQSGNNSINNNNETSQNPNLSLKAYAKDLKKSFISLKSERDISKLNKSKNKSKNFKRGLIKSKSNSKSFSQSKSQDKNQSATPIEFFGELQSFIKKENKTKMEIEKEKETIKRREERRLSESIIKEKKRKDKIDLNKKKYDSFWKKVKYYIDKKNEHLSEITYKLKLRNIDEDKKNYSMTKMNKTSILLYPKSRKPLYRHKNVNERILKKEFSIFYYFFQKERRTNENNLSKSQKYVNYIEEEDKRNNSENKYQKFYEKKLKWLKQKADKIELRRNYLDNKDKIYMKSFSFTPNINKKSIKIVNKRNNFLNFLENKFNTGGVVEKMDVDKNEIYQKYLATIKPYISFYFEKGSPFFKRYKRNFITPNNSNKSINIGMIHVNKGNNIRLIKEEKKTNNDNTKEEKEKEKNENKENNNSNKKNIYNIFKPEKKLNKNREENEKNKETKEDKNKRDKLWWKKLNNINIKDKKKKYNNYNGLYKVNVRQNCSWNKVCVNNIVPKKFGKELLNDFL